MKSNRFLTNPSIPIPPDFIDNSQGNLIIKENDEFFDKFNNKYIAIEPVGFGYFSQVIKVLNEKNKEFYAMKIFKSGFEFATHAKEEINFLINVNLFFFFFLKNLIYS